jgi:AsmA-like C-terminal region/AsmA family
VLVLLALAIFLPPNINGVRFRDRLAGSLSSALGRQVRIGQVKYRVFPRPGFDIYNLQVMDDPAFSAEPLLMCGKVAADLRLTSLWHGRLEIANLKLTDDAAPPSLNVVYSKGHLNLESLMLRVEQVPSAPTGKRQAEQRPRFPYIEATGGRINLKFGAEKKPFTLTNTDFALWLAAEDVWHVRLEGQPVRTDMNLNDTGTLRMEGDLRRSPGLKQMPLNLSLAWDNAQLGQFTSLVMGRDRGWRGGLRANAQFSGTAANLHIVASAEVNEFRRYDINRNQMPRLTTRCLGDYIHDSLELKCDTPLQSGGVLLTARWSSDAPRDYDVSAVATRVPLSMVTTFARHARRTVPDDLTASGDLNAAFGFHSHNGVRNWHGTGMTSAFLLQSAAGDKPFAVSPVHFHVGPVENPAPVFTRKGKQKQQPVSAATDTLTFDSFSVQLGPSTSAQVQATVDSSEYWIGVKGMVPLERLLALGRTTGFPSDLGNTTASAVVDLNISGPWANFAPARVRGTAHLQNVASWIPGIKDRLLISEADAQLSEVETVLTHMTGQFEHTPVSFGGTINVPASCTGNALCPIEFDLHSDMLAMSDLGKLLGVTDSGWNIPFFSDSAKLPDFRATGTLSVGQFSVAELPLEKFTAHVEVGDKSLLVSRINAKLAGGTADGEWHADWSTSRPRFTAAGTVSGVAMDRLDLNAPDVALVNSWISGRADLKYGLKFEGGTPQEMAASVNGKVEYLISNGASRSLLLDGVKPLKFQSLQGELEIEKQALKVLPSKFKAENRIYEMSGTVSLIDRQAKLRVSNSGSRWDITGALDKPVIAGAPHIEATAARSR